jgi:hypothetical protein
MAVRVRTALSQGGFALKRLTAVGFAWLAYGAICTGNRLVHGWTGFAPDIPRTWDDEAIATLEVPLANPVGSPKHVSADYYYRIPVPAIYKSYPVYAPGHEPAGYMDRLRGQEPVILWDSAGQSTLAQRRVVSQHVRAQRLVRHARGLVDPRRIRDDYVPTGWRPYGQQAYAVKGHRYGLTLPDPDRRALIAFLKTL